MKIYWLVHVSYRCGEVVEAPDRLIGNFLHQQLPVDQLFLETLHMSHPDILYI